MVIEMVKGPLLQLKTSSEEGFVIVVLTCPTGVTPVSVEHTRKSLLTAYETLPSSFNCVLIIRVSVEYLDQTSSI